MNQAATAKVHVLVSEKRKYLFIHPEQTNIYCSEADLGMTLALFSARNRLEIKDLIIFGEVNSVVRDKAAAQATELLNTVGLDKKLTKREWQVLRGINRNLSNKQIACELNLSERTVKFHVSSLLVKFGVSSRFQLLGESLPKG
jgi:ATP/maltotriose-dependent transcriptional regulator MalT